MMQKEVNQLLVDGKSCIDKNRTRNHRFTIVDKSGKKKDPRGELTPVKNEKGKVTSWVGVNLDIDEIASSKEADRRTDREKRSR